MTQTMGEYTQEFEDVFGTGSVTARLPGVLSAAKPRGKMHVGSEHVFQKRVKTHLTPIIGSPGILSRRGGFWCAIDTPHNVPRKNEKTGKKYDLDGQMRKARGCIRGFSDLFFTWPDNQAGFIELKAYGKQTFEEQDAFLQAMRVMGFFTAVIHDSDGVEAVERQLRAWGFPMLGRST